MGGGRKRQRSLPHDTTRHALDEHSAHETAGLDEAKTKLAQTGDGSKPSTATQKRHSRSNAPDAAGPVAGTANSYPHRAPGRQGYAAQTLGRAQDPLTPPDDLAHLANHSAIVVRCAVAGNPATPSAVLARLARARTPVIRQQVALNPNTPLYVLGELAVECPEYVASNPALALALIADHAALRAIPDQAAYALLRCAALPRGIVSLLTQSSSAAVADTARLHVSMWPDVDAGGAVTMPDRDAYRAAEQAFVDACAKARFGYEQSDEAIFPGALAAWWAALLLPENRLPVEQVTAEDVAAWQMEPVLARTGVSHAQAAQAALVCRLETPAAANRYDVIMHHRRVAAHPATPVGVLQALAAQNDPADAQQADSVLAALLHNPAAPRTIVEDIVQRARSHGTTVSVLQALVRRLCRDWAVGLRHDSATPPPPWLHAWLRRGTRVVHKALATHWPAEPGSNLEEALRHLATSQEPQVRLAVASRVELPADLLETLALDADTGVQIAVAGHAAVPRAVLLGMLERAQCQFQEAHMSPPQEADIAGETPGVTALLEAIEGALRGADLVAATAASSLPNPPLPLSVLSSVANDDATGSTSVVAPKTAGAAVPPPVQGDPTIHMGSAIPLIPSEIIASFGFWTDSVAWKAAARRLDASDTVLWWAARHPRVEVQLEVAGRAHLTEALLQTLAHSRVPAVAEAVAIHPDTPITLAEELWRRLSQDMPEHVHATMERFRRLARHDNLTHPQRQRLYAYPLGQALRLGPQIAPYLCYLAASGAVLREADVETLLTIPDWPLRYAFARNPHAPRAAVERLSQEGNYYVRLAALQTLADRQ